MPYVKNHLRVNVPKRSGFDKSHRNTGSLTCGTITPLLFDEVIPNSRVSCRVNLAAQLPPLASDTYMNLKLKVEAFFVPLRLCSSSFEGFFCDNGPEEVIAASGVVSDFVPRVPFIDMTSSGFSSGPGTLSDYLGIKDFASGYLNRSLLPFIAYHKVWEDWYRNARVQKPAFIAPMTDLISVADKSKCLPYVRFGDTADTVLFAYTNPALSGVSTADWLCADGVSLASLRQRNFGDDYFTTARLSAQQGPAVSFTLPVSGQVSGATNVTGTATLTISALRAANSLQQFRERNNLPSPRLVDQVKARYGAQLADGIAQRPICIGSATYDFGTTGISQTSSPNSSGPMTSNPFDSVSAQYGRAYGSGSDFIIKDFTANEPGYILVNQTLVPEVSYFSGMDRLFTRYTAAGSIVEMANPLLQNVGDQPIYQYEVAGNSGSYWNHIFGYQDRFAEWMFKSNQIHGEMRRGQSLDSFVLQRGFYGGSPLDISTSFLEIPTNYLDQAFAVSGAVSGLSAWYDAYLDYHVSMPLAEFSIPSLQDPAYEHGHSVSLRRNGQIF